MEHKNPRPNIVLALRLVMFAVRARAGILVRWINQPWVEAAAKSIAQRGFKGGERTAVATR